MAVAEPIVVGLFAEHRTQGELLLIDRITHDTAACGAVRRLGAAEDAARFAATPAMRSALNWQKPLVVVFRPGVDGTTAGVLHEAEYRLVQSGRHTYLYVPEAGEDYARTTAHLVAAGLLVLLVLDADAPRLDLPLAREWRALSPTGTPGAQDIAARLLQETLPDGAFAPGEWVI